MAVQSKTIADKETIQNLQIDMQQLMIAVIMFFQFQRAFPTNNVPMKEHDSVI